jgi:hypothetical protein
MDIKNLQNLNPLEASSFDQVQKVVENVLVSDNMAYAEEALEFLNVLLESKGSELERKLPELYDKYQNYWVQLAFMAFPILDSVDQDNLLKNRVLHAVQQGYEPSRLIFSFFDIFETDEHVKNIFRDFAKSLEQNTETFGTAPIIVEGKKMMPALKYWILDYSKFPSKVAKRGNVERLNYVNQSQNARSLTQVYKQQLLKILKFYDDLITGERPLTRRRFEDSKPAVVPKATPLVAPQPKPSMDFTPPTMRPVQQPVVPQMSKPKVDIQKKLEELKDRRQNAS